MKISEIMRKDVVTINANASIADAMTKMFDERVTSLVIRNPKRGNYGIITRNDIISKVIAYCKNSKKVKVSEIMSEFSITVSPDQDMLDVAKLMAMTGIRRFPVVKDGMLVGIISNSDIFKAVAQSIGIE